MLAILGILLVVLFIFYFINQNVPAGRKYHAIEIQNMTKLNFTVFLPSKQKIEISPKNKITFFASFGEIISASAYNFDGTLIKYTYKVFNTNVKTLYIGNSGIFDDKNSSDTVTFVNESSIPVIFIEKSSKGEKSWSSDIIPPGSKIESQFVSRRSIWQVCHPTEENIPISEIVGKTPEKIIFDGRNIKPF